MTIFQGLAATAPRHSVAVPALTLLRTGAVALMLATCTMASASATADDAPRSISVSGEAERRVAPDMANLNVQVQTQGRDAASAREEADALTLIALETLGSAGVADTDINSTSLSIRPQYRWLKDESRQELTGYRVTRSISARVMDLDSLGPLLIGLSDGGITGAQPPRLAVADGEALRRELMGEAAVSARERAAVIANALGESLGEVLQLDAHGQQRPVPVARERMMMASDAAAAPPAESYSAGLITFRASVSASFALK
jgi:uncharacterized protein YggE